MNSKSWQGEKIGLKEEEEEKEKEKEEEEIDEGAPGEMICRPDWRWRTGDFSTLLVTEERSLLVEDELEVYLEMMVGVGHEELISLLKRLTS